jgi:hypothetical protein
MTAPSGATGLLWLWAAVTALGQGDDQEPLRTQAMAAARPAGFRPASAR